MRYPDHSRLRLWLSFRIWQDRRKVSNLDEHTLIALAGVISGVSRIFVLRRAAVLLSVIRRLAVLR